MSDVIDVRCEPCAVCGMSAVLSGVPADGYAAWRGGLVIQHAMPGLDADDRELLMSGIHADCWQQMWEDVG